MIYLLVSFDYRNWYGVVGFKEAGEMSVREIASTLLLILLLISVVWVIISLRREIIVEKNKIKECDLN